MYTSKDFAEDNPDVLFDVIEANNLGLLITTDDDGATATHLPFSVDRMAGDQGALQCHMAKANPAWRSFETGEEVLCVFSGPHAYVSPTWYESAPMVPTWNYVAAHVYGVPKILETPDENQALLARLADGHEAVLGTDWRVHDLPQAYLDGMLKGIVGFEIPIFRIDGKFKMSQNRKPADRAGVIAGLRGQGDPGAAAVAEIMAGRDAPEA